MAASSPFFDLPRILRLRAILRELDPLMPPRVREIVGAEGVVPRRLAVLPGSFNPLTDAHVALAEIARTSGRVDAVAYLLASRTVDKERVEGASLADRLICLGEQARTRPREGVLLVNRGLYVDLADLIRRAMPEVEQLWFVVGYDKIVQIFDPRYYADRNEALDRLFALASLLVAARAPAGSRDLDEFLARPENRGYAEHVARLDLPEHYQALSSTRAREVAGHGQVPADVPPIVARFVRETGAYEPPVREAGGEEIDRYGLREALVDAVERGDLPVLGPAAFQDLLERVTRRGADGRRRRDALRRGDVVAATAENLEQFR